MRRLSGDGGDELFAGYEWYLAERSDRYYRTLPASFRKHWAPWLSGFVPPTARKKGLVNKFKRFVEGASLDESLEHFRWSMFVSDDSRKKLYGKQLTESLNGACASSRFVEHLGKYQRADALWRQQYADVKTYLVDDILVKVDRMSMANSLEARTPYLDFRLVEFAFALPSNLKLRGLQTKHLLKRCLKHRLPESVLNRKKEGFSIPMKNWLRGQLRPLLLDLLSESRITRRGYFNTAYIQRLLREHFAGQQNHSHVLWSLMVFELWHDQYLN